MYEVRWMHEAHVRFSSEHVSDRSVRYWRDSRFRAPDRSTRPRVRRTQRYLMYAGLLVCLCVLLAFAGCGTNAPTGELNATQSAVNFGAVTVGQSGTATLSYTNSGTGAVQISAVTLTGHPFHVLGKPSFPVNVAAGGMWSVQLEFSPSSSGEATGEVTLAGTSTAALPQVSLSGLGVQAITEPASAGALSGISCNSTSLTGAGSDNCFVALTAAAASSMTVSLSSNNSAITVPSSVTIPASASGIGFTATVAAVTATQTAVLTATDDGVSEAVALDLNAALRVLSASTSTVGFGYVGVNSTATESVVLTSAGTESVTIQSIAVSGSGFSVPGISVPVALNPDQAIVLNVQFDPQSAGAISGQLTISSNDSSGSAIVIGLSGTGATSGGSGGSGSSGGTAALSALSCSSASISGSATDSCTVTLTGAAPAAGTAVTLATSSAAVSVPASVTVPAGAVSAQFTASAAAVATAQSVTLTATAGGATQTFALQLSASGALLSANTASVAFGNVSLNTQATQTVILTSTGTQPVTVSAVTLAGTGFTLSGVTLPVTLNPGQSLTVNVAFLPVAAGLITGQLSVSSNATSGGTLVIALGATGAIPYLVGLTWVPPATSTDPVAGYNVYRTTGGNATYQLLNSAVNLASTYTDSTVQDGQTYAYYVTSVDSSGIESTPSNIFDVTIP